jgi:chromate reductase
MIENRDIKIAGFGGSLRKDSFNTKLLMYCQRNMPTNSNMEIVDISKIPMYNQDFEDNQPEPLKVFKEKVRESDGFIVVTPEYDFSIPGFLKNVFDSASRPIGTNPFPGKVGAIMSASPSMLGGSRAQYHLRQVLVYLDARVINKPEVFVSFAHQKFDENGNIKDEIAVDLISQLLSNLVNEIRRYNK